MLVSELTQLVKRTVSVYWTLLKILVPALVIIRIIDVLGGTVLLGRVLSPVMSLVGLPESVGIVWATGMLTNVYGALTVFLTQTNPSELTVAQVSVLGTMILMAHALPIEGAVAKVLGMKWRYTLMIRIGGALVLGALLNLFYSQFGLLQVPNQAVIELQVQDNSWMTWLLVQFKSLSLILVVIAALLTLLRILEVLGIEKLIHLLLYPVIRLLGIRKQAANTIIIGMTLGLSYGAGVLIEQAKSGALNRKDIFLSLALIGLAHSIIEDTIVIMTMGADLSAVLGARVIFSLLFVALLGRLYQGNE